MTTSNHQPIPRVTGPSSRVGVVPRLATNTVERHYATGLTRENIERALTDAGKNPRALSPEDLTPLEDFHSLGRIATVQLINLAEISAEDRVLDAGTGIGGTARLLAADTGCHVTAVDLTAEYCETADWLNTAAGLSSRIDVHHADVTELPFANRSASPSRGLTIPGTAT